MPERISRSRLERLRDASAEAADMPDPAALPALRSKLNAMRERLLASQATDSKPDGVVDPAERARQLERANTMVHEAAKRLERMLDDQAAPDHVIEAALRDLRIARSHALLADVLAEGSPRF